jgi:hypothetical protein
MKDLLAALTGDLLSHHAKEALSGLINANNFEIFVVQDHGVGKLVEDGLEKVCPQQAAGLWLVIEKRDSSGAQKTPPWQPNRSLANGQQGNQRRMNEEATLRGRPSVASSRLPAIVPALAAATAKWTLRFRTGFIDVQGSAVEIPAIQFSDSAIRIRVNAHLDKSEPSRLAGIPVSDEVHALDRSVRLEQRSNRSFGGPEVEVSDKNILHAFSFGLQIRE